MNAYWAIVVIVVCYTISLVANSYFKHKKE